MGEDLTLPELARRVGEPPERLRQWTSLRLVGRDGREAYDATDIERVRVIQLLVRRGIDLEAIVRANDEETLLDRHVELAFPDGIGTMFALDVAATRLGLDVETLRNLCQASGLLEQGELLSEADLTALAAMKT